MPIVAKRLNFESCEEFPEHREQISPSIIDKIRRKNLSEETDDTGLVFVLKSHQIGPTNYY
jgi:hypothetical protein